MKEIEVMCQVCNLSDALCRNINDNFKSVSFELTDNGEIQTKIILHRLTEQEKEFIEDIMAEFTASQNYDCILKPIVEIGHSTALKNIVYQIL